MSDYQKITIQGRLGRDPEIKETKNGDNMCKFSIANNQWRQGDIITDWYDVISFGSVADFCKEYLKKGFSIILDGTLETHAYVNKKEEAAISRTIRLETKPSFYSIKNKNDDDIEDKELPF